MISSGVISWQDMAREYVVKLEDGSVHRVYATGEKYLRHIFEVEEGKKIVEFAELPRNRFEQRVFLAQWGENNGYTGSMFE